MKQPPPSGSQPWLPPKPVTEPEQVDPWQSMPPMGPPAPPAPSEQQASPEDGESPTVTMMPGDLVIEELAELEGAADSDGTSEVVDSTVTVERTATFEGFDQTVASVEDDTAELAERTALVSGFMPPSQITPPEVGASQTSQAVQVGGSTSGAAGAPPVVPSGAPPVPPVGSAPASPLSSPAVGAAPLIAPPAATPNVFGAPAQTWSAPQTAPQAAPTGPPVQPAPMTPGLPGPPPSGTGYAPQPPRERGSRRKLFIWLGVAAAVAVLAGGLAIVVNQMNASRDPAAQVEEYLDLLASGKAAAASDLVSPGVGDQSLLTDDVLANAEERIFVRSVETLDRSGDGARVLARLELAGEQFEHEFTVDHGANEWLVLDTWSLTEPLLVEASVSLSAPVSAGDMPAVADFSGTELVLAEAMTGDDQAAVYLYPGVYEVASANMGDYLDGSVETLTARPDGETASVQLTTALNGEFEAEILSQAKAYADGCVSINGSAVVKSNMDAACPSITKNTRLSELRVLQYAQGFSDVNAKYFTTNQYEFEVRSSTSSGRVDRSSADLEGEISWNNGKPTIVDARFGLW